jgi:hypothetical protein
MMALPLPVYDPAEPFDLLRRRFSEMLMIQ